MRIMTLALVLIASSAIAQNNPVVIELFTSQGCSSCPAADKNLAEILEEAEKAGQPVFGLSFHVDYWNYVGWKDPYSDAEYTMRQRAYSLFVHAATVYTPQMIVNGAAEFVGSDIKVSHDAVAQALTQKTEYPISLGAVEQRGGKIVVPYTLEKRPAGFTINAAIVERNLENDVPRGENAGRKLAHRNVVRSFVSKGAQKTGVIEIVLPSQLTASSLIVFLQDNQWHTKGAAAAKLN